VGKDAEALVVGLEQQPSLVKERVRRLAAIAGDPGLEDQVGGCGRRSRAGRTGASRAVRPPPSRSARRPATPAAGQAGGGAPGSAWSTAAGIARGAGTAGPPVPAGPPGPPDAAPARRARSRWVRGSTSRRIVVGGATRAVGDGPAPGDTGRGRFRAGRIRFLRSFDIIRVRPTIEEDSPSHAAR